MEDVVLVHKTDRDPEIHPGEPLEPTDCKKKRCSFSWLVKPFGAVKGGR